MTSHDLKIDPAPLDDLLSGDKTGEVRRDDRGFAVGDTVRLTCADGREAERRITHIQRGYGLPDGICVLSYAHQVGAEDACPSCGGTGHYGDAARRAFDGPDGDLVSREAAARLVDAECARILSKQDGIIPAVDTNLRMIASVLPDIAAAILALPAVEQGNAEVDRLTAELDSMCQALHAEGDLHLATKAEVAALRDKVQTLGTEGHAYRAGKLAGAEIRRAERDALRAQVEAMRVTVKSLVWEGPDENGDFHADHAFGSYEVYRAVSGLWLSRDGVYSGRYQTSDLAKAAAQADYDARIRAALSTPAAAAPQEWKTIETAPKDGRMVCLLVDYTDGAAPLDDAEIAATIGFNSLDDTGEDEWHLVGWSWSQDCFTDGQGTVIGWTDFSPPALPLPNADKGEV
ncbi:DUF3850 domain-containing protein [Sinirhodobacter populi]|uniref:DUF3850 domain-containing protein n=1 Tax=Paenirhodobacter populi TaxID=2306993 RepID=A0A443K7Z5_9RHOB|nr:DUF3850 domain-containing protein [Sinirhodobacter populi]RWR28803.1 DUF3850 domain-containing protein [Sinirhodobacter populi]